MLCAGQRASGYQEKLPALGTMWACVDRRGADGWGCDAPQGSRCARAVTLDRARATDADLCGITSRPLLGDLRWHRIGGLALSLESYLGNDAELFLLTNFASIGDWTSAPSDPGRPRVMFRSTSGTTLGAAKPLSSVESAELRRRYTQIWLAAGMLISGAANTLTCKQAFLTVSSGHVFNHPFVQAGAMFLGEVCCLIFYLGSMRWRGKRVRWPPRHVLLGFAIPAWCDIIGTSTMYMGLTMTSASTYQMLRGSVVIFTGLMSRVMLRRATAVHQVSKTE